MCFLDGQSLILLRKTAGFFVTSVCAQFTGNGSSPPVPNFYQSYASDGVHNKPMVITETSAMYNPSNTAGQTDYTIKSNWWQQVFNVQGDNSQARLFR